MIISNNNSLVNRMKRNFNCKCKPEESREKERNVRIETDLRCDVYKKSKNLFSIHYIHNNKIQVVIPHNE